MDTKSKNTLRNSGVIVIKSEHLLRNSGVKLIAFILAVLLLSTGIFVLEQTATTKMEGFGISETWDEQDYLKSSSLRSEVYSVYHDLFALADTYRSEEYIRSGAFLDDNAFLEEYKLSLLAQDRDRFGLWEAELGSTDTDYYGERSDNNVSKTVIDVINSDAFMERHGSEIEKYKAEQIQKQLQSYAETLNSLESAQKSFGLKWYIERDGQKRTSGEGVTPESLIQSKVYLENDKGKINASQEMSQYNYGENGNTDNRIVLAFDDRKVSEVAEIYSQDRADAVLAVQVFFVCGLLSLICLVVACIGAGRRETDNDIHLLAIDRVYWDLHLIVLAWCEGMLIAAGMACIMYRLPAYMSAILLIIAVALAYNYVLSIVRVIKAHRFMNRFGTAVLCKKCWHLIKRFCCNIRDFYRSVIKGRSLVLLLCAAIIICAIVGMLIVALPPIGIILLGVALWFGAKRAKSLDQTIKGVERIYEGDTDYKIEVEGHGPVEEMAKNINNINEGLSTAVRDAVEKELKSERLKTELITNVSHDIRTPLTSIITYIDLLKKEDIDEESRERYIAVLEQKAARLKALTDDLFEAAKASTGNIEVHWDAVNMEALVNQGMGELEDKIEESGLQFIVTRPQEKVLVHADGRLLWRIIENLLSNVLKYALPGSRVYMTVDRDMFTGKGVFVIKNISADPLNIPAEELLERFKRGDDTRHSEGSGLGLAIARDLTELQNGQFDLTIDGDLFKATVYLELVPDEAPEDAVAEDEASGPDAEE
ncbi:HAMP domain-containing sensor histidine kinase [Eubacterium sp. 1001713B170207_170306_E7]|uniref:sensor histidine kinase n=1 Tax=Eubacterium sp. 1001713B170207_170306_E7 TaxID=2787097 RepID=UPI00189B9A58|nr:HAMP domain-containing sensor histidine kinase [Eubacterium sp. 1001713B170207_170306_E7]